MWRQLFWIPNVKITNHAQSKIARVLFCKVNPNGGVIERSVGDLNWITKAGLKVSGWVQLQPERNRAAEILVVIGDVVGRFIERQLTLLLLNSNASPVRPLPTAKATAGSCKPAFASPADFPLSLVNS